MKNTITPERSVELMTRMNAAAEWLRDIAKETGINMTITITSSDKYESPCSEILFGHHYLMRHFYNGEDDLAFKSVYPVRYKDVAWTDAPECYQKPAEK